MGHNKKRNTISSKKYYGVIITIAALMVFTAAFFTVVPCIAANTTYEDLTDAVITIDKIRYFSKAEASSSCYVITSTDGNKYFVVSREGFKAIKNGAIKEGDICSIKYIYWFFQDIIQELKIDNVEYISYEQFSSRGYIIIGICLCLFEYGILVLWRKSTFFEKDKPKYVRTNKAKPHKKKKWKKGRKGKDKRK